MKEITKRRPHETSLNEKSLDSDARSLVQEKRIEPFTPAEIVQLIRMDAIHDPVLAEYWGDDADDDLIANP